MPTLQVAIWNVECSVGTATSLQTLMNFTGTLAHNERYRLVQDVVASAMMLMRPPLGNAAPPIRLFLAPEYLFARSAEKHVVSYETKTQVLTSLTALSERYPALILFPGTVAYFKELDAPNKEWRRVKYARMIRTKPNMQRPVRVSHNTAYVFHGGKQVFKYRKVTDASELDKEEREDGGNVFVPGIGPSVFRLLDQRIGIEVCADHERGYLFQYRGQSDLDVHIIVSASTTFKSGYACVREGGIVCHADSSDPPAVYQKVRGVMVAQPPVGISNITPSLNPHLAPTADEHRSKYTTAVENKFKSLPTTTATLQMQKKEQQYLNASGGKLGVFEVMI